MSSDADQVARRREKLDALRQTGRDPFAIHRFERTHTAAKVVSEIEEVEGQAGEEAVNWQELARPAAVCGRLMALRRQGKSTWADLHDVSGKVQLWAGEDVLDDFEGFNDLDRGDIVGVHGEMLRTRRGEPTLRVKSFVLLAKALRLEGGAKLLPGNRHSDQFLKNSYGYPSRSGTSNLKACPKSGSKDSSTPWSEQ